MPVTFGELSTLTTPLSVARFWALFFGCVAFSLASSTTMDSDNKSPHLITFYTFCMVSWCLFFTLTFLIVAIYFIQFHSLLPLSWKNLTATVASFAALMTAAATFAFPWITVGEKTPAWPREVAAVVASFLTTLAYILEFQLIRTQGGEQQRGYMATVPGLLKTLQVFGGLVGLVLLSTQVDSNDDMEKEVRWRVWVSGVVYGLCLLSALGTVVVMVGDCAGRCPVPFDRLLAGFSLMGVMGYMVATVMCFSMVLRLGNGIGAAVAIVSETVVVCVTLLAYTVDLAFSIKLLCARN